MPEDRSGVGQGLSNFIMCQEKLGKTKIEWEGGRERKKGGKKTEITEYPVQRCFWLLFFFQSFIISDILQL